MLHRNQIRGQMVESGGGFGHQICEVHSQWKRHEQTVSGRQKVRQSREDSRRHSRRVRGVGRSYAQQR